MGRKRRKDWAVQAYPKMIYLDNGSQFQPPSQAVMERILTAISADIRQFPGYTPNPKDSSKDQSADHDN